MAAAKDLAKWALRRMGYQLTRLGSPAAAPSRDINVHRDLVGSSLYLEQEDSPVNDGTPRRVRTASLDDVVASHRLEPPYLLKVVVQGAELDALSGGDNVLPHVESAMLEPLYRPLEGEVSQVNTRFVRRESALRRHHFYTTREQREKQDHN